jgi:hypothetical protein
MEGNGSLEKSFAVPDDFDEEEADRLLAELDELPPQTPPGQSRGAGTPQCPSSTQAVVAAGAGGWTPEAATPAQSPFATLPDEDEMAIEAILEGGLAEEGLTASIPVEMSTEDPILGELFRLGALPDRPMTAVEWHTRAAEIVAWHAKTRAWKRASLALAKADATPSVLSSFELEAFNSALEAREIRMQYAAAEKAAAAHVYGTLEALGGVTSSSHTASARMKVWETLLPVGVREREVASHVGDQQFRGAIVRCRRRLEAFQERLGRAMEARATAMKAFEAERAPAASTDDAVVEVVPESEAAARVRRVTERAIGRAVAELEQSRRDLRNLVREHLSTVFRLSPLPGVPAEEEGGSAFRGALPPSTPPRQSSATTTLAPTPWGGGGTRLPSAESTVPSLAEGLPMMDHSLGAAVTSFALVFSKIHPMKSTEAARVVRWQKEGDPPPPWPAVLFRRTAIPWGADLFVDSEGLFERRPPPESLGFALAVQDVRTFAWVIAQALERRYPELIPLVPAPRASGDEADVAQSRVRGSALREVEEWRQFLFECALDAAVVHTYEPLLALCMDRWADRDLALMG